MSLRNLSPDRVTRNWNPAITDVTGSLSTDPIFIKGWYSLAGNEVNFKAFFETDTTNNQNFGFQLSLPVGVDVQSEGDIIGVFGSSGTNRDGGVAFGNITNNTIEIIAGHSTAGTARSSVSGSYRVPG